jgi:ribonucleoside-triphosphate reductase
MAENLGVKNAAWDKKDGFFVPRDCYNSYFYLVESDSTNIIDKFVLHGDRLTKYLDGGSALHLNLQEHLSKGQYLKLLDVMIKTGCSYATINVPNTQCKDCKHISKHRLKECPKCGSKNLRWATRIIGYLKYTDTFAEPRQAEEARRTYDDGRSQIQ